MSSTPLQAGRYGAGSSFTPSARDRDDLRGPPVIAWALCIAALCVLGLVATWVLAELVPAFHLRDATLLYHFTELSRPGVDVLASTLLALLDPLLYTVWALLLIGVALVRHRPRVALAVAVVLPAAPLTAELLKPLLAHPHDHIGFQWIGAASWPSGHATAATTLVLCALLVAPRRLRPVLAVPGASFVAAVGVSLLILAWHMPSDVLGGYLLATLFVALAVAALGLSAAARRGLPGRGRPAMPGLDPSAAPRRGGRASGTPRSLSATGRSRALPDPTAPRRPR